jgi:4'-phosphopantetheinyl transferase EntD
MEIMTRSADRGTSGHPPHTWTSSLDVLAWSWTSDATTALAAATGADGDAMQGMSPRRAADFSMGRLCARKSIAALGGSRVELGRLPNGAVDWPAGWTGSISHSRGVAVACVGSSTRVRAIGVDIEPHAPLPRETSRAVAHDCFIGRAAGLQASGSRVGFSARESAFKALSAIGRAMPILSMTVTVAMETTQHGRFTVHLNDDTNVPLQGRWHVVNSMVMTTVIIGEPNGAGRWRDSEDSAATDSR